jgi:hypothetical protein
MKLLLFFALLAVLVVAVSAWEKEDHEIFDLVSEIEAVEGKGTSFYSWLDVPSTATTAEISKAYRRKSMLLHPDKNPGVKGIHERFARLGVIAAILRDPVGRKRYDHFYKNGVPKWRGTGYYYSRWRPGIVEVLIFLTIVTSLFQYIVQHMNYKRNLKRIQLLTNNAKLAAWGPKMIPVEGKKKVKVPISGTMGFDDEGNQNHQSEKITMVVEGKGDVFFLDAEGDLHPLDIHSAVPATIGRTWFFALLKSLKRTSTASDSPPENDDAEELSETASETAGSGTVTPNDEAVPPVALKGGRAAAVKAGGKRRKMVRKR